MYTDHILDNIKNSVVELIPLHSVSVDGIHCPSDPHETVVLITS